MPNDSRDLRKEKRNWRLQRSRRTREVVFSAEKANNIHDANLAYAPTILEMGLGGLGGVIAAPYANVGVAGPFQSGQRVGDGGGHGQTPQRRLPKAKIGYFIA